MGWQQPLTDGIGRGNLNARATYATYMQAEGYVMAALIKCKDCGGVVSRSAKVCPHCGAKQRRTSAFSWFVLVVGVLFLFVMFLGTPPTRTPTPSVARDPETQEKRKNAIEDLVKMGVWTKVHMPTTYPHAYTGLAWDGLTFDQKQTFCDVTLTYFHADNPEADTLFINDGRTGKKIGIFSNAGLEMY